MFQASKPAKRPAGRQTKYHPIQKVNTPSTNLQPFGVKHWLQQHFRPSGAGYWMGVGFILVVLVATIGGLAGGALGSGPLYRGEEGASSSSTAPPAPSSSSVPLSSTASSSSSAAPPPATSSHYEYPGAYDWNSVNVMLHGAAGDGVTDDLPVIQSILYANNAAYIPPGNFRVAGPVIMPSNSYLKVEGVILLDVSLMMAILIDNVTAGISSAQGDPNPVRPGIWSTNITVDGGVWDSQATISAQPQLELSQNHNKIYGVKSSIVFLGVDGLTLKNMVSRDAKSFHYQIGGSKNVVVTNITFEGLGKDGIHFSGPIDSVYVEDISGSTGDDLVTLNCVDWGESGPFVSAAEITTTPMDLSCTNILVRNLHDFATAWNVAKVLIHSSPLVTANAINVTYDKVHGHSASGIQIGHTGISTLCSGGTVENFFVNDIKITSDNAAQSGFVFGFTMGSQTLNDLQYPMHARNIKLTNVQVDSVYFPDNAIYGLVRLGMPYLQELHVHDFLIENVTISGKPLMLFQSQFRDQPGLAIPSIDYINLTIRNVTQYFTGAINPIYYQAGGNLRNLLVDRVKWSTLTKHNMAAFQLAALTEPASVVFTNNNINGYDALVYVLPDTNASLVSVNVQSTTAAMRAAIVSVHPPDWEYHKHSDLSVNTPAGPAKVSLRVSGSVLTAPSVFMAVNQTLDNSCFLADITTSTYNPNLWISLPHYNFYSPELATPANATSSVNSC